MLEEPRTVTVFLIDDQTLFRASLRSLISAQLEGFTVVGDEADAREGIRRVGELRPDLVVLDITMPGLSGIDSVRPIKQASPSTRVLIASQHEGHQFVRQALDAGADGYLTKNADPEELASAIRAVSRGDRFVSTKIPGGTPGASQAAPLDVLTPREREVFQLLAVGKANKEIAGALSLSLGTVKKHRENLQRKLDCHSPADLARLAIREGLLDP